MQVSVNRSQQRGYFERASTLTLEERVRNILEWLDWRNIVKSDTIIFVKPNFTWPRFRPGVVTTPDLLRVLLGTLKERADRVIIGESDLSVFRTSQAFIGMGIDSICRDVGAEMMELTRMPSTRVETKVKGKTVRLVLPKIILEKVDALVNVPVPKCHVITTLTGAMKNLYGLIPDPYRGKRHRHEIDRAIVAVNKLVKSDLVIVDGLYSLDGRGPIFGTPIKTNALMGSNNAVVADSLIADFFDLNPEKVSHLRLAVKEGLGNTLPENVFLNQRIESRIRLRARRKFVDYLAALTFKSRMINTIAMDSPITPLIYSAFKPLRAPAEVLRYKEDVGALPQSQFSK